MEYYNHSDFLQYFDTETIRDLEVPGIVEYDVTQGVLKLHFYMDTYEETICCNFVSDQDILITFTLEKIAFIKTEKNDTEIKFVFYQENKPLPVLTAFIKPTLALHLNLEQEISKK